jgi:two-component system cell cycle response regulator
MKHIIHVDNSEFFRKLMKTFLSEHGFESESFSTGEETMNAVNAGNANCIITGLTLADMSGEELVKRLVVSSESMLKIVVTSSQDEAICNRLKALGVKTIIQKSGDWKKELGKVLSNN